MNLPAFFAGVRPLFGGSLTQPQVNALDAILDAWSIYGDGNARHLAYILATAKHETGDFKYMREIWGPTTAQKRYEGRADLGNTEPGDGRRFLGRGFVQITGRRNYTDWSKRLGIDLVAKPELAEQPAIAARILVEGMLKGTFTGKKLSDFPSDFVESRRVVNGTDRAVMIAGYAHSFLEAIRKANRAAPETPDLKPSIPTPKPAEPASARRGINWLVIGILFALALAAIAFLVPLPI